jgi:hypothetical protein
MRADTCAPAGAHAGWWLLFLMSLVVATWILEARIATAVAGARVAILGECRELSKVVSKDSILSSRLSMFSNRKCRSSTSFLTTKTRSCNISHEAWIRAHEAQSVHVWSCPRGSSKEAVGFAKGGRIEGSTTGGEGGGRGIERSGGCARGTVVGCEEEAKSWIGPGEKPRELLWRSNHSTWQAQGDDSGRRILWPG